jgi:hypothetical protein
MNTTAEPPAERPAELPPEPAAKTRHRTWLIVGAATVVGIGVIALSKTHVKVARPALSGGAVALSKNKVIVTGRAPSGGGWTLDHPVNVRGHTRQQAYGPGRSLRKPVQIAPYSKGPGMAA